MKLIEENLPKQWEEGDGSILFTHEGYMYDIGSLDGIFWMSRQREEDYYNGLDNWEKIERWIDERRRNFNFLRDNKPS